MLKKFSYYYINYTIDELKNDFVMNLFKTKIV